ncbi:MAG: DUF488 domain-containing protein [Candidatus Pacebacteria bacterium]|nr:DUF488 domain-containing protein [Candidatus Paceibacterota bacterium]
MALHTEQITRKKPGDGLRISVMSRHTLSDGITPDSAITEDLFDKWWPELAPPDDLIRWYYGEKKRKVLSQEEIWSIFEPEFNLHLQSSAAEPRLHYLAALARNGVTTILCIEPTPEYCHRRLIAEACRRINPTLTIIIE